METWNQREIAAGEFKAKCLHLMDEVNRTGMELIITKRGIPVARLLPVRKRTDSPFGWMAGTVRIVGDIVTSDPTEWQDEDDSHDPL